MTEINGDTARLDADEARHCLQVLRHKIGDTIEAIDGAGVHYAAQIVSADKKGASLSIIERTENWGESPTKTGLLLSPPKSRERLEWLIEKAVELGLTHLYLAETKRAERERLNYERLNKIMVEALKQCKRSRLPVVFPLNSLTNCLKQIAADGYQHRWLAYCEEPKPIHRFQNAIAGADCLIAIGPEGDFTPEEVAQTQAAGFEAVSLGKNRLRTETAALAVLGWLKVSR